MKYWVYINGQVPGCYLPGELAKLAGFTQTSLVCPAEGEISEKNWRRAGEFADLAVMLEQAEKERPPLKPAAPPTPALDVDSLIDNSSQRLFGHVAELMKELQDRREDKALVQSLQRQLAALRADLQNERERNTINENRVARISDLEDVHRRDLDTIAKLDAAVRDRDERVLALSSELDRARQELEAVKRRLGETANDLAIRNGLVDKISRDLTEKELSLAKSLAVIRRLEEDLHRIVPAPLAETAAQIPAPIPMPEPAPPPSYIKEEAGAIPAPPPFQAPAQAEPAVPRPVFSDMPEIVIRKAEPLIEEQPLEPKTELSLPAAPAPAEPPKRATTKSWLRKGNAAPTPSSKKEFTDDEPPTAPPILEPDPEKLGAQNALVDFFRRVMKKDKPEA